MPWGDDATRFLKRVLPWPASDNDAGHGNLHWNSISNESGRPYWVGKPFRTPEKMVGLAGYLIQQPNVRDLYFCTSLQAQSITRNDKQQALRSIQNTVCSKVLFLDIDVKPPPKGYTDTKEALTALGDFLKKFKYPFPNAIVHSGRGLHVYWIYATPMSHIEWLPRAEKLRSAAVSFGLRCDGQCTIDIARILRIPETSNWKTDPPGQVKLLHLD